MRPKNNEDFYLEAKLDKLGNLYQLIVEPDFEENYVAKMTYNCKDCPSLDEVLNNAI